MHVHTQVLSLFAFIIFCSGYSAEGFARSSCWQSKHPKCDASSIARSCPFLQSSNVLHQSSQSSQDMDIDQKLLDIAKRFKLEVFDLDEGIFGFDSNDSRFGLEVLHTEIPMDADHGGGLGLVLTEMAGNDDGRGLVLISQVSGNAAKAQPQIHIGDVITGVRTSDRRVRERTTGLNYDRTVQAIGAVKEAASDGVICFELNRLVERAVVQVEVTDAVSGETTRMETLAGENLRRFLLRRGIKLYDRDTKRFDMPYATGDCAGEGLCGTCLVAVKEGMDQLSPMDSLEKLITKGRPMSWRASCRTVIGPDNKPGKITLTVKPQSQFPDELNPGVRSVSQS